MKRLPASLRSGTAREKSERLSGFNWNNCPGKIEIGVGFRRNKHNASGNSQYIIYIPLWFDYHSISMFT